MSSRIAITGATGFLGRHLIARLQGEHDLVALSRRGHAPDGVDGRSVDVLDPAALTDALAGCDAVVHAAGNVSHEQADAAQTWRVHVDGTKNVLAAARAAGVKRVLHISSSGTIAISEDPNDIADDEAPWALPLASAWPYYRAKIFAEMAALDAAGDDLEVLSLNPSLLLGPGDDFYGTATEAVRLFLDDGVPFAPSGGLAFVDVRDVADAVALALTRGRSGRRYLLNACNLRFSEFYGRLARLTGKQAPVARLPNITRRVLSWLPDLGRDDGFGGMVGARLSREQMELASVFWYCSSRGAESELGWQARDPNQTLADTVGDLRALNT